MSAVEQPSRQSGYKAVHRTQAIAGANDSFVVPVNEVAEIIEEHIELMEATTHQHDPRMAGAMQGSGVITSIVLQASAATHNRWSETRLTRRLWSVRACEGRSTKVEIADALLRGCDINIEDTDIPTFPAGAAAAHEAVTVHFEEVADDEMTPMERKRLERSLLHFAQGYIHGFHIIDQHICKGLEALFQVSEPATEPEPEPAPELVLV